MKLFKSVILTTSFSLFVVAVNAQTTDSDSNYENDENVTSTEDEIGIPDSYMQEQNQLDSEYSSGTSSYNIDDSDEETAYEESSWRTESEGEELRVYSGFQDGNNTIKTIKVAVPESMQTTSSW